MVRSNKRGIIHSAHPAKKETVIKRLKPPKSDSDPHAEPPEECVRDDRWVRFGPERWACRILG